MPEILTPDLCVIGAGAGGLALAAQAAAKGAKVVLLEKARMGGQRLHSGCIPAKALIAAAKAAHGVHHAAEFGISAVELHVNYDMVRAHIARAMALRAPSDTPERMGALGVQVVEATGRFISRDTCAAGTFLIKARRFALATGSSPVIPKIPGLEMIRYLTSETLFASETLPKRLLVLGGGSTGVELGQAYRRLGSEVTVVECAGLLAQVDPELALPALKACVRDGMALREATRLVRLEPRGMGLRAFLEGPDGATTLDASHLLLAVGRQPNVHDLGLEAAGVPVEGGRIRLNAQLRTVNPQIFALGDVAGLGCFTHLAEHQAEIVLANASLGQRARPKTARMPRVVSCDPEIAEIGLSEAQARAAGHKCGVYRWPLSENDRARASGARQGLIKIITKRNGRILGVGIVGEAAAEMLAPWALALERGLKLADLATLLLPYPTLGEIARHAARQGPGTGPGLAWTARLMAAFKRLV